MRHKKLSFSCISGIAPPYRLFFLLLGMCLPILPGVFAQNNTEEIERTLTGGDNLPVMFRRRDEQYDRWILKLKAPHNHRADVGPPDSPGWSLNVGGSGTTTTIGQACGFPEHAIITWIGSPDGEAPFHARIEGNIRRCPSFASGGGGGNRRTDNRFQIEIIDGLVFLVERESEARIGGFVRIAAYRRQGDRYGDEDRVPVEVTWSCADSTLVFHHVLTDANGEKTPGNPLTPETMRRHEVFVTSNLGKAYTVHAELDGHDNGYDVSVDSYSLTAYVSFYEIYRAVDMNRDGRITVADRALNSPENPWRFWYNDDRDFKGEGVVSEYNEPGPSPSDADFFKYFNSGTPVRPPVRDLTDLYPLLVHVRQHFEKMKEEGREKDFSYRIKFVGPNNEFPYEYSPQTFAIFTELSSNKSIAYLDDVATAEQINQISITNAYRSWAKNSFSFHDNHRNNGIVEGFVERLFDGEDGAIMLLQHFKTGNFRTKGSLKLEVVDQNNTVIFDYDLHLSLSNVEDMFAHLDLTGFVKQGDYTPQSRFLESEPLNYPDELTNDTRFIYVHGYNNMTASQGSNAENFKRLHLLGSRAKYIAVSWYGWESQEQVPAIIFPLIGQKCPDYQVNVNNAFRTAPYFAQALSQPGLSKASTYIMAHSLGNMVVSSAIEDHDFDDVKKYFMVNAAVASESYSFDNTAITDMAHNTWQNEWQHMNKPYERRLFSYAWSENFDADQDPRSLITWQGRFASVPEKVDVYSFWSRGDTTFWSIPKETPPMPLPPAHFVLWGRLPQILWIYENYGPILQGDMAWVRQEKLKGWGRAGYSTFGGWSINPYWQDISKPLIFGVGVTDQQAGTNPYWGITGTFPPRYHQVANSFPEVLTDQAVADQASFRNAMLSYAISARRLAVGGTGNVPGFGEGRTIELESLQGGNGWPVPAYEDEEENQFFWDHGSFQTIALPYVFNLYMRIINEF